MVDCLRLQFLYTVRFGLAVFWLTPDLRRFRQAGGDFLHFYCSGVSVVWHIHGDIYFYLFCKLDGDGKKGHQKYI